MMKSSNISEKNGAVSSNGMHASPAVGAKCVKSSGSSFNTENNFGKEALSKIRSTDIKEMLSTKRLIFAKNYETDFNCAQRGK